MDKVVEYDGDYSYYKQERAKLESALIQKANKEWEQLLEYD
jgi:hypothetical protein